MADGATLETQLGELLDQEYFEPPKEFAEKAVVTDDAIFESADADYESFWAEQAEALHWHETVGPGAGLVEPAVREVVRRWPAERLLQLPRSPRGGRPG
jgi:hypothetical protein